MSYIPIEDLMSRVDSKYRLIVLAAKRAKQLNRGVAPALTPKSHKPTSIALEEIAAGRVTYEVKPIEVPVTPELPEGPKPTWFRSLTPEEAVSETSAEGTVLDEEETVAPEAAEEGGVEEEAAAEPLAEATLDEEEGEKLEGFQEVTESENGEEERA